VYEKDDRKVKPRRRTGFENDLREALAKILFGVVLGALLKLAAALWLLSDLPWGWALIIGVVTAWYLGSWIHGHSRFSDDD
jgi:hypothetical protein